MSRKHPYQLSRPTGPGKRQRKQRLRPRDYWALKRAIRTVCAEDSDSSEPDRYAFSAVFVGRFLNRPTGKP